MSDMLRSASSRQKSFIFVILSTIKTIWVNSPQVQQQKVKFGFCSNFQLFDLLHHIRFYVLFRIKDFLNKPFAQSEISWNELVWQRWGNPNRNSFFVWIRFSCTQSKVFNCNWRNFLQSLFLIVIVWKSCPGKSREVMVAHWLTHWQVHEPRQLIFKCVVDILSLDVHWDKLQIQS